MNRPSQTSTLTVNYAQVVLSPNSDWFRRSFFTDVMHLSTPKSDDRLEIQSNPISKIESYLRRVYCIWYTHDTYMVLWVVCRHRRLHPAFPSRGNFWSLRQIFCFFSFIFCCHVVLRSCELLSPWVRNKKNNVPRNQHWRRLWASNMKRKKRCSQVVM